MIKRIASASEYDSLVEGEHAVFAAGRIELPQQVFVPTFGAFRFAYFDALMSSSFWPVIAHLMGAFGDTVSTLRMRQPDASSYYFENFGRYGALRMPVAASAKSYFDALQEAPIDSPVDSIQMVANTVSICGDSRSWGIWADRDLEIAIMATKAQRWPHELPGQLIENVDAALELMSASFRGRMPAEFAKTFRHSYLR